MQQAGTSRTDEATGTQVKLMIESTEWHYT